MGSDDRTILIMVVGLFIYFLPGVIAYSRGHQNRSAIATLNLLLGWTFIGWVIAMVWAHTALDPKTTIAAAPRHATKLCPFCAEEIQAAAIKCKHCGADIPAPQAPEVATPLPVNSDVVVTQRGPPPNSASLWTVAAVLSGVMLLTLFAHHKSAPTVPANDAQPQAPTNPTALVTSPEELCEKYTANEVATDQWIAGRPISLTEPVLEIDKDFADKAVLQFATVSCGSMSVAMANESKDQTAALTKGQVVTISCPVVRRILGNPTASECVLQTAPAPQEPQALAAVPEPSASGDAVPSTMQAPSSPTAPDLSAVPTSSVDIASARSDAATGTNQAATTLDSGPSFDCSKVINPTALAICGNAELSELDRQMAARYYATDYAINPNTRAQQRQWIRERNATCGAGLDCLRVQFNERIKQLQQSGAAPPNASLPAAALEDRMRSVRGMSEAEFGDQFRCPESYATDHEKEVALAESAVWLQSHGGQMTQAGIEAFRVGLLTQHNCVETLRNIHNVEPSTR